MDYLAITLAGVALAIDASAVTVANCTTYGKNLNKLKSWSMPVAFTFFQMLMPILGFYLGYLVADYIEGISGFITAGVFFILAIKIVLDNISEMKNKGDEGVQPKKTEFTFTLLVVQGISTSIDALFVGVTYGAIYSSPFIPALIIGGVTLVLVSLSMLFGKYLGKIFNKYAGWVGAVILLGLSIKSLVEAII